MPFAVYIYILYPNMYKWVCMYAMLSGIRPKNKTKIFFAFVYRRASANE